MKKWNYTLKTGTRLRKAINEENHEEILQLMIRAYREIINYFIYIGLTDEKDFEDEFNYYTENILLMLEDKEYDEDEINYELSDLYDLCDNNGIWIPLR